MNPATGGIIFFTEDPSESLLTEGSEGKIMKTRRVHLIVAGTPGTGSPKVITYPVLSPKYAVGYRHTDK